MDETPKLHFILLQNEIQHSIFFSFLHTLESQVFSYSTKHKQMPNTKPLLTSCSMCYMLSLINKFISLDSNLESQRLMQVFWASFGKSSLLYFPLTKVKIKKDPWNGWTRKFTGGNTGPQDLAPNNDPSRFLAKRFNFFCHCYINRLYCMKITT